LDKTLTDISWFLGETAVPWRLLTLRILGRSIRTSHRGIPFHGVKQLVGCDAVFGSELWRQINDALFCPRGTREIVQALSNLHPHIFRACEHPSGVAMLEHSPERVMAYFHDQRVRLAAWYFTRPE